MIRLGVEKAPEWVTLVTGVDIMMRPANALDDSLARETAMAKIAQIAEAENDLREYGMEAFKLSDLTLDTETTSLSSGFGMTLYAVELAKRVATDWRGVGDAEGNALQMSRKTLGMLFLERGSPGGPSLAKTFLAAALSSTIRADAEGNVSGAEPNGSTGTAPVTA
jgi:hypothetical protein